MVEVVPKKVPFPLGTVADPQFVSVLPVNAALPPISLPGARIGPLPLPMNKMGVLTLLTALPYTLF